MNGDIVSDDVTQPKVSILIVDDEPSVGDALKLVLESSGYEVVLVNNGLDGIDQARKRRFGFSVVDLFLTDISGLQVIADIRHHQPQTPILLITAHGSPQVFAEAEKLGACAALAKPFPPAEILKIIDSHVHGSTDGSA
ncbi:MAG TPA: response regulator [Pyrinomonadaceae bacterium]|jgi:DNA-binding response OmpR family regulator